MLALSCYVVGIFRFHLSLCEPLLKMKVLVNAQERLRTAFANVFLVPAQPDRPGPSPSERQFLLHRKDALHACVRIKANVAPTQ